MANMKEGAVIERMFSGIAHHYDCVNRLMSWGLDQSWRRSLAGDVHDARPKVIVDLATGSGDVLFELWKTMKPHSTQLIGIDFCQPMLDKAQEKSQLFKADNAITFMQGDCLALPLDDESVDCVTIAFGLRNVEDRHLGLQEMYRILRKPNGRLFVMEFTQPHYLIRPIYFFYLKRFIPFIAQLITQQGSAYRYLAQSISTFPEKEALKAEISAVGFKDVSYRTLGFSTVALHRATF